MMTPLVKLMIMGVMLGQFLVALLFSLMYLQQRYVIGKDCLKGRALVEAVIAMFGIFTLFGAGIKLIMIGVN